jgi:hypothetical protein
MLGDFFTTALGHPATATATDTDTDAHTAAECDILKSHQLFIRRMKRQKEFSFLGGNFFSLFSLQESGNVYIRVARWFVFKPKIQI